MTTSLEDQPIPPADEHQLAKARFHRAIARAHDEYADSILSYVALADDASDPPALRGSLQRRIVSLGPMTTMRGMSSREVATAAESDEPNSHTALKGLVEKKVLEVVDGASPQRFRLTAKHRRNRVLRLSRLLEEGEWATYGDFAIAAYGSRLKGRTVGQMAAHNPAFANPHRVLLAGGIVSPEWRDEDGKGGPEDCKRRLAQEGSWDRDADRAAEANSLDWAELLRRLAVDENSSSEDIA